MNLLKKTMWVAVVSLVFFSCGYVQEMPLSFNEGKSSNAIVNMEEEANPWILAANPLNPFDETGYLHNRILADTESCTIHTRSDMETVSQCVSGIMMDQWQIEISTAQLLPVLEVVMQEQDNLFVQVVENTSLSDHAKNYLRNILAIIQSGPNDESWWDSYPEKKQQLIDLEAEVYSDMALSSHEQQAVLAVASVARYSAYYWMHDLPEDSANARSVFKRIIMRIATITGDIGGAVGGFLDDSVGLGGIAGHAANSSAYYRDCVVYGMPG